MKLINSLRVTAVLMVAMLMSYGASAQGESISVDSCRCTAGSRIESVITIIDSTQGANPWILLDYDGISLPDSVLWLENDPGVPQGDEFYLSFDQSTMQFDTLDAQSGGPNFEYSLTVYRDPTVEFSRVVFIRTHMGMTDTLITSLGTCLPDMDEGLEGSQMIAGLDTVCLDNAGMGSGARFDFVSTFDTTLIDTVWWMIAGPDNMMTPFDQGQRFADYPFTVAGDYTLSVFGMTISNCPISGSMDIHVVDTDISIEGFTMGCVMGDTMPFNLSANLNLSVYDSVIWEVSDPMAGSFVGDSINVSSVNVAWSGMPGTYVVRARGEKNNGVVCDWMDSLVVTIASEISPDIIADRDIDTMSMRYVYCEGDLASFKANVLNLDSIVWYLGSGSTNTLVGDTLADSIMVQMDMVGFDTLYVKGTTMMGCEVRDTILLDTKGDGVMLSGPINVCLGDTIGYRAMYTDGSVADFVDTVVWTVMPPQPPANISRDSVQAMDDSLTVVWSTIGDHQIIVSGMTSIGCEIMDTIDVNVQDTNFLILGDPLVCAGDISTYRLVQAHDSTEVVTNDTSVTWRIVRTIMVDTLPLERPEYPDPMIDMVLGNDSLIHSFSTGTYFDDDSWYLLIASGVTDNGCTFSDTLRVETIGRPNVQIVGPDTVCVGRTETYTFTLPDSLLVPGSVNWSAFVDDTIPVSPFYLNQIGMDTLMITFPNDTNTIRINFSAEIEGSGCMVDADYIVKTIDTISFVEPMDSSICLTGDTTWYVLNLDTNSVSDLSNLAYELEDLSTNAVSNLPSTFKGDSLATYVVWQTPGMYDIRAVGYTDDGCRIEESHITTVKDTNYIIAGDDQICIGDTQMYVFIKGWDSTTVDTLVEWSGAGSDTIAWTITNLSGTATPQATVFSGRYADTLVMVFDTAGTYRVYAEGYTECCQIDAELQLNVRGTDFLLLGDTLVCDGASTSIYYIANTDSTRINDLNMDSTTWSLASGVNGQINAATSADSLVVNWNLPGSFNTINDTIYFRGVADDGCIIHDTLPVILQTSDYILLGDDAVCTTDSVRLYLATAHDSSAVDWIDSITWIITRDGTSDTTMIMTPSTDTLDRLDMAGTIMTWTTPGTYDIQSIGTTAAGCIIYEERRVQVYGGEDAMIMGDLNTCYRTDGRLFEPDVYKLINIEDSEIMTIQWEIIPLTAAWPQPLHEGLTDPQLVITQWTSSGNMGVNTEDYRIKVTGTSLGGCTFADSVDVIILPTAEAFTMVCNNAINITLPASCELVLTPDMILEDWESMDTIPEDQFEIRIKDPETGLMLSNQGIVDPSMIGRRIQIEIEHECSGQTCWGTVLVEDKNIPELLCGRDTIECADEITPEALDFRPGRKAGYPVPDSSDITVTRAGSDNTFIVRGYEKCGDATLVYNDRIEKEICIGEAGTIIYRDWTMTNLSGVSTSCTDTIVIKRLHIDTFIMMFEDELRDSTFECGQDVTDFANPDFNLEEFCFNIQWTTNETKDLLCGDNPNTYISTKTWTFVDWCDGTVRKRSQTLTVADNRAPDIALRSSDIRTEATDDFCFGIIELTPDDISIRDSSLCSDIDSVRVRVFEELLPGTLIAERSYSGNFTGLIISDPNVLLDLDNIFIVVEAWDACANAASDTVSRRVIIDDSVAPDPVCDQEVVVNLNSEGWGFASWLAFDRGSTDNCGPVDICITRVDDEDLFKSLDNDNNNLVLYTDFVQAIQDANRDGTNYGRRLTRINGVDYLHIDSLCVSKLKFECDDAMASFLGNDVQVRMKVTDIHGRSATCLSDVEVRDDGVIDTIVVVKGDTTLTCGEDYSRFIPFDGGATVRFLTQCGIPFAPDYSIDTSGLNACGLGVIRRTYRATDRANRTYTHVQTITVGDPADIVNPDSIPGFWPQDYAGEGCTGIDPSTLPVQYRPKWDPDDYPCSNADMIYTDLPFYNVEGYCVKILRTWTLVDWCQKKNNDPNAGSWEYVQVLKLTDTVAPVITMETNPTVRTTNVNNCSAFVSLKGTATDCFDDEDLIWTYRIEQGGALLAQATSQTIARDLTEGVYTITWTAEDQCGNADNFIQTLAVLDGAPPTVSCQDVTVNLGSGARVTVQASDMVGIATDACDGELDFFFDAAAGPASRIFDCDDLNGQSRRVLSQVIVAVDDRGNVGQCRVRITLTDDNNVCGNAQTGNNMAVLEGAVVTASNHTVDNVELILRDQDNVDMNKVITPENGQYNFANVPTNRSYDISAQREDKYDNGVTTFDMILMQRHILGLATLDSPYKVIAADVDGSGRVMASDIVAVRRLLLGRSGSFPVGRSWTFVDASQQFDDPLYPFPYRDHISVDGLSSDLRDLDLIAVKMGDLNGNATLASTVNAGVRSQLQIATSLERVDEGLIAIHLTPETDEMMAGMQAALQLNTDLVEFVAVGSQTIDVTDSDYSIGSDGLLRIALATEASVPEGGVTIYVSSVSAEAVDIEDILTLSDEMSMEVYTEISGVMTVHEAGLEYVGSLEDTETLGLEVLQNVPNPFVASTKVKFYSPQLHDVQLRVYDTAGRQIYSHTAQYGRGWHEHVISADDLEGPGVYIYEINNGIEIVRKRMMSL